MIFVFSPYVALHGWPTLTNTTLPFKRKEKKADRDFMSLNRAAVSAGKFRFC
jgi:hypothetical protein